MVILCEQEIITDEKETDNTTRWTSDELKSIMCLQMEKLLK